MIDALVYVVAAFFGGMGAYALAAPARVLAVFGVSVQSVEGRNEVRAVYGGFGLAVAALLVAAATGSPGAGRGILVAVAFATAGMAVGRVIGGALERPRGFYPVWFWFSVETAIAAALLAAAWT